MRNRRRRRAGPLDTFILVWLFLAMFGIPIYEVAGLIFAGVIAVAAGIGVAAFLRGRDKRDADKAAREAEAKAKAWAEEQARAAREAEKAKEAESPYSPEVTAIINEGRMALKEMGRLYRSIPDPEIRKKINELMSVSDKIVRDAIDDPSDVPQIRKFLDYYLPTTIKLLNAYDRMSAQDVEGENITGSMERIEDMLDTTIVAYKKQLDALFANQAADIQMDIEVMNGMLAREGLGGKSYLDWNDFMKQYEQQQKDQQQKEQKGSTAHG